MSKEISKEDKKVVDHVKLEHGYELAFHIVPSVGDQGAIDVFEKIKKILEDHKAKIVSSSEPTELNLEYQMEKTVDSIKSKYNTAYFSWIIFQGGDVVKIDETLKHEKEILRFLIIKTEQSDSIPTQDVANILNENMPFKKDELIEDVDTEIIESEEENNEIDSEEIKETEESLDDKKIDEAIDELVK